MKHFCYFYKDNHVFEFTWSHIFKTSNAEDTESYVRYVIGNCGNYNALALRVNLSPHVCNYFDDFFKKNTGVTSHFVITVTL